MPRMIDLIRAAAVPANLVQSAARGSLSIPSAEMLEILVYLAKHNSVFGQQAALTLAGWDENSSKEAAANPHTSREVLEYFAAAQNFRPGLLPSLLLNPAVSEGQLAGLASLTSREGADAFLANERVCKSQVLLNALASNANLSGIQSATVDERLAALNPKSNRKSGSELEGTTQDDESEHLPELAAFLSEHAGEISAEGEKPFQPLGGIHEEIEVVPGIEISSEVSLPTSSAAGSAAAAAAVPAPVTRKAPLAVQQQRGSALQKISKLDITGRIQLAMKGSKEERSLLIRDGTKIVALAVLESPKLSDAEVEKFASQKNVLEAVLRAIPLKRRFMKNYNVVRNLVFNPRTPIDLSLGLMKNLLVNDLKNLSSNKEVSETIRKLALRQFRQKTETKKKD